MRGLLGLSFILIQFYPFFVVSQAAQSEIMKSSKHRSNRNKSRSSPRQRPRKDRNRSRRRRGRSQLKNESAIRVRDFIGARGKVIKMVVPCDAVGLVRLKGLVFPATLSIEEEVASIPVGARVKVVDTYLHTDLIVKAI